MPLSNADLAAIEARVEAAPEGPWHPYETGSGGWDIAEGDPEGEAGWLASCEFEPGFKMANFCAHARTDVPALLADLRELRELRAAVLEYATTLRFNQPPGDYADSIEREAAGHPNSIVEAMFRAQARMIRLALGRDADAERKEGE